jgi:hypothetical protein
VMAGGFCDSLECECFADEDQHDDDQLPEA